MKKQPRDYQIAAVDALWNQIHSSPAQNPLVVMPTGSGKSLSMALFMRGLVQTYPHLRVVNLTHVKELVDGNSKALLEIWPTAPIGVYSAGLGKRQTHGQITFAGIASFRNAVGRFGKIDFIIVDEAHRISDNEKSGYQKVFAAAKAGNPNLVVIGFTATDYRMGMGKLTDGGLFDAVCFDLSDGAAFVWMIEQHYLLRLVPKNPGFQVDDSEVKTKAGEYDEKSASDAFREQDILERAVDDIILKGKDRQAWLTFAQSIDDCELIADMFRYKKYPVEAVHSRRSDRDEILAAFRAGGLRGIVNKDILTTGYDDPRIDLIAMLRLTRSPGLWVQMLGRGTRPLWTPGYDISPWEGRRDSILASPKQNCLVLDYAGNTPRLGPINYPRIPKRKSDKGGAPPMRECPQCATYNHISLRCCEECGYEFPIEVKIAQTASTGELILDFNSLPPPEPKEMEVFAVERMIAAVHKGKTGKPPTMRVDYFCGKNGIRRFSTWVCPEHPGYPGQKAKEWWRSHRGAAPMPATAADMVAVFDSLTKPYHIKIWLNTKYPEIEAYDFLGTAFELPPEFGGPPLPIVVDNTAQIAHTDRMLREMFDDDIPF